ncbi:hypothetical protein FSARC_1977 [Fusarium sarcochroum]|uniref:Long-chain-alcohol oxidase n=1 Tax=Fusarium sarcochroum TaxID=1208366 RepID=A0A8H4U7W6_9HYPO|nr:hypothetical protein FSARC_1977 [Fusarium sarcochroum]
MTGPTSIGLPQGPSSEPLTEAQWHVLMAVMDTVIAPCSEMATSFKTNTLLSDVDVSALEAFLAEKPSDMPLFQDILKRILANMPPDKLSGIDTDVVIVGSGCGAGVVAKNVAAAGYRVLVVEKGHHVETSSLPLHQSSGYFHLFEQGGLLSSEDGSISLIAGSCFGGGGTVNWSAALQLQNTVRDEWADERGLKFFKSSEFQARLDSVCEQMGVSDEPIKHNHGNSLLLEGGRKLGFNGKQVPQNTGRCEHQDGYCALGCWTGQKNGPVNGWLPDAAKCGAKFVQGLNVNRVLFRERNGAKVACGVKGTWTPRNDKNATTRTVTIRAKKIVISAGSLCTPVILKNSGLKNPHIGRNLHLHPTSFVAAIFKQETRPWEGGSLTSVITSFDNLDGHGHGVKLERPNMLPSMCLTWLNWTSGPEYKSLISKYPRMEAYIAITRDRDSGLVTVDPVLGVPRVAYTPSKFDTRSNMKGMISLAKILYIQGALEIHPVLPGLQPFVREQSSSSKSVSAPAGAEDVKFEQWLKQMETHGNKTPDTPFASAHQMSSCRMSAKPSDGVVDEFGRVWGCENLIVADASIFPSASGVNPMVTTMAISDRVASAIVGELVVDLQEQPRL